MDREEQQEVPGNPECRGSLRDGVRETQLSDESLGKEKEDNRHPGLEITSPHHTDFSAVSSHY